MSSDEASIRSENEDDFEIIQEGNEVENGELMETESQEATETLEAATAEGTNNDENENKTVVKPKRAVRKPLPKLNAQTLMGPRGLQAIEGYFERVKFKGKGHEEQDLNVLMKTYEYWCHRLFPKFPFDTCIARLETLGTKKATITHVKRIRMGVANEDENKPLSSDEEVDDPTSGSGFVNEVNEPTTSSGFVNDINDQFDQLLSTTTQSEKLTDVQLEQIRLNKERAERLRREKLEKIRERSNSVLSSTSKQSQDISDISEHIQKNGNENLNKEVGFNEIINGVNMRTNDSIIEMDQETDHREDSECNQSQVITLSKEQIERMRQNKERAAKIRKKKMEMSISDKDNLNPYLTPKASEKEDNSDVYKTNLVDTDLGIEKDYEQSISNENGANCEVHNEEMITDEESKNRVVQIRHQEMEKDTSNEYSDALEIKDTTNINETHNENADMESEFNKEPTQEKIISDDENEEIDLEQMLNIINENQKTN